MKEYLFAYDDFTSYINAAESGPTDCVSVSRQSRIGGLSFNGGLTFDGALRLAREGWAEGRERVERYAEVYKADIEESMQVALRSLMVRDVAGEVPDVAAFVAGAPEQMMTWGTVVEHKPTVRLVVSMSISGSTRAETIFKRGAAVCSLVDLLESAGRRVEVTVCFTSSRPSAYHEQRFIAKHAESALQMDSLSFILAHPASLRRLGFSVMEQVPYEGRRAIGIGDGGSGYGSVTDTKGDRGDIYVPAYVEIDWDRIQEVIAWLIAMLERMEVIQRERNEGQKALPPGQ